MRPALVVSRRVFTNTSQSHGSLLSWSFFHLVFSRASSFFGIFLFLLPLLLFLKVALFFSSSWHPYSALSFPAFRNGRALLRWSLRGARHFRPNGPSCALYVARLCKLNERDGRLASSRKRTRCGFESQLVLDLNKKTTLKLIANNSVCVCACESNLIDIKLNIVICY